MELLKILSKREKVQEENQEELDEKYIGEIVKKYREDKGISQEELASRTNLSHTYINWLEKTYTKDTGEDYQVVVRVISELADAMDMPLSTLLKKIS